MRRYEIVAYILLILSVFGSVLAAPVAVQDVREACADAGDEGDNMIIGSGKRAEVQEEEDPLLGTQQEPSSSSSSSSDWGSTLSQYQGSSSAPNYASVANPNPSFLSSESRPAPLSTSGGTEVSWNNPEGEGKLIQSGTSTEIQPPSSSKAKSVSFAPSTVVIPPSGEIYVETLQPETKPPSTSKAKSVSFAPLREIIPPSGKTYSETLPPDFKFQPRPLFLDLYQAKMAARPTKPKSNFKNIFSKLIRKLKFWRRISGTAGGVD